MIFFQADVHSAEFGFLAFGLILFVWEFLPTFVVVLSFRVKIPNHDMLSRKCVLIDFPLQNF